jgi:hypothetical protein
MNRLINYNFIPSWEFSYGRPCPNYYCSDMEQIYVSWNLLVGLIALSKFSARFPSLISSRRRWLFFVILSRRCRQAVCCIFSAVELNEHSVVHHPNNIVARLFLYFLLVFFYHLPPAVVLVGQDHTLALRVSLPVNCVPRNWIRSR